MNSAHRARQSVRGFSMVELMVAIVLAGIIFAAMVPFFANALKRTSGDALRVDFANIAQDRIEQVRLLPYADITQANLNFSPSPSTSPFGDGYFGTSYTVAGNSRPFRIQYYVTDLSGARKVTVVVDRTDSAFTTRMDTIVRDPAEGRVSATGGPTPSALPTTNLSITVSFKNWSHVYTGGVTYRAVNTVTNQTFSPTPLPLTPLTAGSPTVKFTGLPGGMDLTYTVSCHSSATNRYYTSPPFHLLTSARLRFDTNPGGQ